MRRLIRTSNRSLSVMDMALRLVAARASGCAGTVAMPSKAGAGAYAGRTVLAPQLVRAHPRPQGHGASRCTRPPKQVCDRTSARALSESAQPSSLENRARWHPAGLSPSPPDQAAWTSGACHGRCLADVQHDGHQQSISAQCNKRPARSAVTGNPRQAPQPSCMHFCEYFATLPTLPAGTAACRALLPHRLYTVGQRSPSDYRCVPEGQRPAPCTLCTRGC